jgi:hypothetical protein
VFDLNNIYSAVTIRRRKRRRRRRRRRRKRIYIVAQKF